MGADEKLIDLTDVYNLLLGIKSDLGEIRTTASITAKRLDSHIEDDKELSACVTKIELEHARQLGGARVWALVAGATGTMFGGFLDYLLFRRGH